MFSVSLLSFSIHCIVSSLLLCIMNNGTQNSAIFSSLCHPLYPILPAPPTAPTPLFHNHTPHNHTPQAWHDAVSSQLQLLTALTHLSAQMVTPVTHNVTQLTALQNLKALKMASMGCPSVQTMPAIQKLLWESLTALTKLTYLDLSGNAWVTSVWGPRAWGECCFVGSTWGNWGCMGISDGVRKRIQ